MRGALPPTAAPISAQAWRAGVASLREPSGAASRRFAEAVGVWSGVPHVWPTASGRAALFLLLEGMRRLRPARQEVLFPAYTCPALVPVIERAGLRPRLVDVTHPEVALDPTMLAERLSEESLAVIHVHPFGLPRPVDEVRRQADAAGAWLIEDAAQAMGATLDGERVGRFGAGSIFSLGPGKALSTGGGGLLAVRERALRETISQLYDKWPRPSRGASLLALARLAATESAFRPVGWRLLTMLRLNQLGDSAALRGFAAQRLSDAQAAVGTGALPELDEINEGRRRNAEQLLDALGEWPALQPVPAPHGEPIYLRLPLLVEPPWRERLLARLRDAGLGAGRLYPRPLHHLFPHLDDGAFPGAEAVASQLLTLPTHAHLRPSDIERIAEIVRRTIGGRR